MIIIFYGFPDFGEPGNDGQLQQQVAVVKAVKEEQRLREVKGVNLTGPADCACHQKPNPREERNNQAAGKI